MTIILVYAPTTSRPEEEVDDFYELLQSEISHTSNQDFLIVMGDWNSKVGDRSDYPVVGKYGLGNKNDAGDRMIDFCKINELFISNTMFQQHKRRLYTWTSPNGLHKNQIDYICGRQRWQSSFLSTKTYPGADCGTDHKLLVSRVKIKLKGTERKKIYAPKLDVENIPERFKINLNNRFSVLNVEGKTSEELWGDIRDTLKDESRKSLNKI